MCKIKREREGEKSIPREPSRSSLLRKSGNAGHLVSLLRVVEFRLVSIVGRNRHVDIVGGDGFGDERSVMREDSIQGVVEGDSWEVGSL